MWQHVKLSEQIRLNDILACCWDIKHATNNSIPYKSDFKIGMLAAALPDACRCGVRTDWLDRCQCTVTGRESECDQQFVSVSRRTAVEAEPSSRCAVDVKQQRNSLDRRTHQPPFHPSPIFPHLHPNPLVPTCVSQTYAKQG